MVLGIYDSSIDVSDGRDEVLLRGFAALSPSGFRAGTPLGDGNEEVLLDRRRWVD